MPNTKICAIPVLRRSPEMAHGLVKAAIIPEIIRLITEKYSVSEEKALDMFYTSATTASLDDDETGLYGQSPLYIFSIFNDEMQTVPKGG
jgi:hypothetical protein